MSLSCFMRSELITASSMTPAIMTPQPASSPPGTAGRSPPRAWRIWWPRSRTGWPIQRSSWIMTTTVWPWTGRPGRRSRPSSPSRTAPGADRPLVGAGRRLPGAAQRVERGYKKKDMTHGHVLLFGGDRQESASVLKACALFVRSVRQREILNVRALSKHKDLLQSCVGVYLHIRKMFFDSQCLT